MFKYICFRSRSFYIDDMYSLLYLLVIPFFFGHFLVSSFIFFVKIYIYPLSEIVKSLYIVLRTTIIRRHMDSKKHSDSNRSKYWFRYSEHFNDESTDEDDSEDAEIPSTLQDSSDELDGGVVEKDSGNESNASTVETGSISDDEPLRRRAKCKLQVEQSPVQIFTAKSGRQ